MTVGPDTVVQFTAPSAGEWEFNTTGSDFDTVMYARTSCLDETSELDCNDDIDFGAGLSQSRVRLNLEEGQTVYLFVDTYDDQALTAAPFTITAKPFVMTNAPVLDNATFTIDTNASTVGVILEGSDVESDTLAVFLQIFNEAGEGLFRGDGISVPFDTINHDDMGNFVGTLLFPVNGDLSIVVEGELRAVDAEGQQSMPIRLMPGTPAEVARGEACDGVTAICDAESVCVDAVCADPITVAACPEEWPVTSVEPMMDGTASIAGDSTDAMGGYRAGSCGGGGATQIYSFVAPADGVYVVNMDVEDLTPDDAMDNADTVLFARRLCNYDAGTLGADLACNDDRFVNPEDQMDRDLLSRISFQADAGETTYIFADSYTGQDGGVAWRGEYTLNIVRAAPPVLDTALVSANAEENTVGVMVTGTDTDVAQVSVTLTTAAGMVLPASEESDAFVLALTSITHNEDGTFTGWASFEAPEGIDVAMVGGANVVVIDETEQDSNELVEMIAMPADAASGDACDPLGAVNICSAMGEACYSLAAGSDATCQVATAPVLTEANVYMGVSQGQVGVTVAVAGTDAENDVSMLRIVFRDANGDDLFAEEPIPALPLETTLGEDGGFSGEFTGFLQPGFAGGSIASVDVSVMDRAGLESAVSAGLTGSAPAELADGATCNPSAFSSDCGAGGICSQVGEPAEDEEPEFACAATAAECPGDWTVTNLADHMVGDGWQFVGNTADNVDNTQGTCVDANGPEGVASLSSQTGGFFVCDVDAGGEDTVMYVRSHCGNETAGGELACNDDADEGDIGFQSRVRFFLVPGRTAFVFVDGFGGAEFEYTLNCTADTGAAE
jgi:hypothetical protein